MLKKDSLERMANVSGEWCVSMYMPVNNTNPEKNRIRLKNLIRDARKQLLALGTVSQKANRMLAPLGMIVESAEFWKGRKEGFAAFISAESFVWYSLQYDFDELVVVTDRLHLKPLVRSVSETRRFHLLALSQKQIRFYEASEIGIGEVFIKGLPKNIELPEEIPSKKGSLQMHSSGNGGVVFHGQGDSDADRKGEILELFRRVDLAVSEHLKDDGCPLLLAGVEYLHPIYREVNTYAKLHEVGIHGNVENMIPIELLEKALPLAKPIFRCERENAGNIYLEKRAKGLTSTDLPTVFKAAFNGRIDTLFVPVGKQAWGVFDEGSNTIIRHEENRPGDKDLLCVASSRTLINGGRVFVVLRNQMPDRSTIAAVMRY